MRISSCSVKDTLNIGKRISRYLNKGDIICLSGDLGSGKTVLTKGIASGLGIRKDKVVSPTFVLLRQYKGRLPLYHFDLYRLSGALDIAGLGYEEYFFDEGVTVVEWADKLESLLPKEHLLIKLSVSGEKNRILKLLAVGQRYQSLIKQLKK